MSLPKNPTKSFISRNPELYQSASPASRKESPMTVTITQPQYLFGLTISGQIIGGKNNICITRTGRRFPNKKWASWRDKKVAEVVAQLPAGFKTIDHQLNVSIGYVAGDRRRRDFPAICDSIWHVLEKAGVVTDDTLLWPSRSTRSYNKEEPMAILNFYKP